MKYIFALILLAFVSTATAGQCDMIQRGELTNAEHSQLIADCYKKAEQLATSSEITETIKNPGKLSEWGNVAKDFATAIGIAAKELGIAVNDFFKSDAGTFLAMLLFWKVAGASILSNIVTLLIFGTMIVMWFKALNKITERVVEYEYVPVLWGMFSRKRIKSMEGYVNGDGLFSPPGFFLLIAGLGIVIAAGILLA